MESLFSKQSNVSGEKSGVFDKLDLINRARNLLRGEWNDGQELTQLCNELEKRDQFAYAAEVLIAKMVQDEENGLPISLKEHQQLAKFIYKDHSLPSSFKLDKALQQLNAHDKLTLTKNCETLGLAGAIYKYRWLYDHQPSNLEFSKHYYLRGMHSWKEFLSADESIRKTISNQDDEGYTTINYAYLVELAAVDRLEREGSILDLNDWFGNQLEEAHTIRKFILNHFLEFAEGKSPTLRNAESQNWVLATVAEAYFGLRQYDQAEYFIKLYKESEKENWKRRTFSRQLLSIAYMQHIELEWSTKTSSEAVKSVLNNINGEKISRCLSILVADHSVGERKPVEVRQEGKMGMALSGGGNRAALFHIGVLAALAEQNKLKDIEVISCVSGGSILGAYYYLKLRKLLEAKPDKDIEREDYIELVKEIEVDFLKAIQHNLRMRVLSNLFCNFCMIFSQNYSRTNRLGELYERYLYNDLLKKEDGDPICMSDIRITPAGEPSFSISTDNWKRKNKVPQLILNATSLNTGHNWQFAATWMGEPPGSIQSDIDVKPRLRRMYYEDAPGRYKKFRIGYAVGASSCVPVMFTPLPMRDLYPGVDLQLVDGGLHDNQGIAALIEQECNNMIISDASGQMPVDTDAKRNELAVFYRADSVLQERLRELQFKDLKERKYTTQLHTLLSVHLKSDLQREPVSWNDCTDPPRKLFDAQISKDPNALTQYGILKKVQQSLSEIRTDLDAFNDVEAYALMYSGYQQTRLACRKGEGSSVAQNQNWKFLEIEKFMVEPEEARKIEPLLRAAKNIPFKVLEINRWVHFFAYAIAALLVVSVLAFGYQFRNENFAIPISPGKLVSAFVVLLVGVGISKTVAFWLNIKTWIRKRLAMAAFLSAMWVVSNLYLWIFNPLYNKAGKIKDLK